MAEKLPFGESASINRPPLFCGLNYQWWKVRMKIFVESIDRWIRDAIVNGHFIPKIEKDDVFIEKPWSQWTESETKKAQYDYIAKTIISSSLNSNEFSGSQNVLLQRRCGTSLRLSMKAQLMWRTARTKKQPSNWYNVKNVNEFNSTNYTCFGCGKQGHIKVECPSNWAKRKGVTRSIIRKANQEEHTMMIHLQVLHQRMIRKKIFVSW